MKTSKQALSGYYQTAWWVCRSRKAKEVAGDQCQWKKYLHEHESVRYEHTLIHLCKNANLDVHHVCYDNLYQEKDEDLIVLCRIHHIAAHLADVLCPNCGDEIYSDHHAAEMAAHCLIQQYSGDLLVHEAIKLIDKEYCSGCNHMLFDDSDNIVDWTISPDLDDEGS